MRFNEFQRKRASFSHNVLKNGVVIRLPEECARFILEPPSEHKEASEESFSRPDSVSGNLLEAARVWLTGGGVSSGGVVESLEELFRLATHVQGFRPRDDFGTHTQAVLEAAKDCSAVMTHINQGRFDITDEDWNDFVRNLKSVVESVDELRGGHQNFDRWLVSTLTASIS
jgi:hypothetical protein